MVYGTLYYGPGTIGMTRTADRYKIIVICISAGKRFVQKNNLYRPNSRNCNIMSFYALVCADFGMIIYNVLPNNRTAG